MKLVIQVCSKAYVETDGNRVGQIGKGAVIFVGIGKDDDTKTVDKMTDKLIKMRIYPDLKGKTNLALKDIGGSLLIISQFTLYANCRHGNRPSFVEAKEPIEANKLYEYFIDRCKRNDIHVEHGIFGADMQVGLVNEGPFTIVLDSEEL
ncbi:MAG: D-tyrosyl-tRNA(Tyr) deacylase [Lachnospiraceae bacterium]|nr:D-tyrosyl-tRNA(Tyr) deacylase [Lachnospiraceae bacterium]